MQIHESLKEIRRRLAPTSDAPELDSQVLLAHILHRSRTWILSHPETQLTSPELIELERALVRLESGVPLPYVLGRWEFYGLEFLVTPDVLIPRPETELLVERALNWLERHPQRREAFDAGTGSGCIAVSLAKHCPDLSVVAVDISRPALQVASENARLHKVEDRIEFVQADLLPPGEFRFHLIAANLPYIPTETLRNLRVFQTEPSLALQGGPTGLDLIRRLLQSIPEKLTAGGMAFLEIEASQGEAVRSLATQYLPGAQVAVLQDLAGHDRLVEIQTTA